MVPDQELFRIDGPLNDSYLDHSKETIATALIRSLGSLGWLMLNNSSLEDRPHGFQIDSYIEDVGDTAANVLVVSKPKPIKTVFGGYRIAAKYYDIDMKKKTSMLHPSIILTTDDNIFSATTELVDTFLPRDMVTMIAILNNMKLHLKEEDYHSDLDPRVAVIMAERYAPDITELNEIKDI